MRTGPCLLVLLATLPMPSWATDRNCVEPSIATFPGRLTYRGLAFDAAGAPLAGRFAIELAYFDSDAPLLLERHESVEAINGRFTLELGTGTMSKGSGPGAVGSLHDLFARHPDVEMSVTLDGIRQAPRVHLLPAGHSTESRLVLAGRATADDGKPHAKGYRYRSTSSAVQAVALRPAKDGNFAPSAPTEPGAGPFEIDLHGPWRSRPVRELRASDAKPQSEVAEPEEINAIRHEELFDANGARFGTTTEKIVDPLVELAQVRSPHRTPAVILQFEGVGNLSGVLPPDTTGAVGPDHYLQVVNSHFQIFNKNGTSAGGPYPTNSLWTGYGGACETDNSGDAIFLYDRYSGRWILSQFAIQSGAERVCFAISESSDPLGGYSLYELITQRFPDYFKLGVWPDPANNAILMSTNSGFQGAYDVYALDRESMIAGLPARPAKFFQSFPNLLMPADANGALLPPGGSPGLLYTFRDGGEPYFGNPPKDSLDLYSFHIDWATPANSTLTLTTSFTSTSGGFADFNWTVCGFFESDCLPQPETAQGLDSGSWWPMQRFQYRRFTDHEALVGSWTVDLTGSPDHAAPRWFELRRTGGAWSIFQQGTHAPDSAQRWEPSVAMDGDGNLALGYSIVDAPNTLYASIRYATRAAGDPLGTLQTEQTLFAGSGAQTHSAARWGDYSSLTVDPVDDCTFWYTNEYLATTGSAPWQTRVGAFIYPGCGGLVVTPSGQSVCGTVGSVNIGVTLSGKFDSTTDLSLTGCPGGASCLFTQDPVVFPETSSTLQLSSLGAVTTGTYNLQIRAEEVGNPTDAFETSSALQLFSGAPTVSALSTPANAASNQAVRPLFSWSAAANADTYALEVATDAGFSNVVYSATVLGASHTSLADLPSSSTLYWRVGADNVCGPGPDSSIFWFDTLPLAGDCAAGETPLNAFSYGFETGANGWTSGGTGSVLDSWAASSARVHSGSASWHANDPGAVTDQRLVSPAIALPFGQSPLTLAYWNWRSIESKSSTSCYDGAIVEVSTNGGSSWVQVTSGLTTDPYTGAIDNAFANPLGGLNGWCGGQEWKRSLVALDSYAGQSVRFRFRLGSDNWPSTSFEGWYLDDVEVRSCVPGSALFADSFETGNATRWSATEP